MNNTKKLREQILSQVSEYARQAHGPATFVPGSSRIPYAGRVYGEEEIVNLVEAALDFWLTAGPWTDRFEKKLADYLGVKHAFLVNSGSSANLLAFMALTSDRLRDRRICPGDEVITVAACFPTTVAPIVQYGAIPVFLDVTLPTYNIDTAMLEQAVSPRTKAVMLAHTLGNPFAIDRVKEFCQHHNLWLIEDNCDALGSLYRGRLTGTFGDIGTSSFYPPHHMTTGEGGAVYTSDPELAGVLLSLRDWGRDCTCPSGKDNTCGKRFTQQFGELPLGYDHKYVYSHFGYNLKPTDMQSAIGCAQIEKLPSFIKKRRENFIIFSDSLCNINKYLILPEATPSSIPSWFGFPITLRDDTPFKRIEIVNYLENNLIQTRMLFAGNLLKHPCFQNFKASGGGYRIIGDLSQTTRVLNNTFWIGLYPGITNSMTDYIINKFQEFFKS